MILGIIGLFFNWQGNWLIEVALGLYMLEHLFALFSPHSLNKVVVTCAAIPIAVFFIASHNWGITDISALIVSIVVVVHTLIQIQKYNRDPQAYQQRIIDHYSKKIGR